MYLYPISKRFLQSCIGQLKAPWKYIENKNAANYFWISNENIHMFITSTLTISNVRLSKKRHRRRTEQNWKKCSYSNPETMKQKLFKMFTIHEKQKYLQFECILWKFPLYASNEINHKSWISFNYNLSLMLKWGIRKERVFRKGGHF